MFRSISEEVRKEFRYGNRINQLVIINVSIFLIVNIIRLILFISNAGVLPEFYYDFVHFLSLSSDMMYNVTHPWVFITHAFLHEGIWHIVWNMFSLYWFGNIVEDLIGKHKILPLYLIGALAGVVAFVISSNFIPFGGGAGFALGASAAVMAFVMAAATLAPDYLFNLILLGEVRIKYIALFVIVLDVIAIPAGGNTGGHWAHLGGALIGYIFVQQLRAGNDWTISFNKVLLPILDLFNGKSKKQKAPMKVVSKNIPSKTDSNPVKPERAPEDSINESKLDKILDKIKQKGFNSLTDEEKDFLHRASKD